MDVQLLMERPIKPVPERDRAGLSDSLGAQTLSPCPQPQTPLGAHAHTQAKPLGGRHRFTIAAGQAAPAGKWAPKLAGLKKEVPNLVNLGHVGARL